MFCFGTSYSKEIRKRSREIQKSIHINVEFPSLATKYLPKLSEHKVQDETEEIIDDPSIIFYDPCEKPGFVYTAIPFVTKDLDFSYEQPSFNTSFNNIEQIHKSAQNERLEQLNEIGSSEYDDSLDGNSTPNTPLSIRKEGEIFNKEFEVSSRRDSLEFDNMLRVDHNYRMNDIDNFIPGLERTENLNLHESIHQTSYQENSFVDDYTGLNLYEENILSGVVGLNLHSNKGYISDAESIKTYQDSGIYDDDIIDSPKALTGGEHYSKVARHLDFGSNFEGIKDEKYSAFKTPMSSKQSSMESLLSQNEDDLIMKQQKQHDDWKKLDREQNKRLSDDFLDLYLGGFRISDRPKRMIYRFMVDENVIDKTPTPVKITKNLARPTSLFKTIQHNEKEDYVEESTPEFNCRPIKRTQSTTGNEAADTSFENGKYTKPLNKYSYVQAKVQCHRYKGDRSPSPGVRLRSQSPGDRLRSQSPGTNLNTSKNSTNKSNKNQRNKSPGGPFDKKTISSSNKAVTKSKNTNITNRDRNKVFNEKLTFRERAKSRTDTHGVEMYSNLPKEFQEIARRLARQDREIKKSETDLRVGRSTSRRSSKMSSRASSMSPIRGRSKTRNFQDELDSTTIEFFSAEQNNKTPSRQLSRSSSIRSIPSTPAIGKQHPLPELQHQHTKSPSVSPGRSPAHNRSLSAESKTKISKQKKKKENNGQKKGNSTSSSVSKLYTFTTVNDSLGTSPVHSGNHTMFHVVPVR